MNMPEIAALIIELRNEALSAAIIGDAIGASLAHNEAERLSQIRDQQKQPPTNHEHSRTSQHRRP